MEEAVEAGNKTNYSPGQKQGSAGCAKRILVIPRHDNYRYSNYQPGQANAKEAA